MSSSDDIDSAGMGGDDARAAEFVLGLLPVDEHGAFQLRLEAEPELRRRVRFWRQRLSALDTEFTEVAPPPAVRGRLEAQLFADESVKTGLLSHLWGSVGLWRGLAAAGVLAAAVAIGSPYFVRQPAPLPQAQLVANLAADESNVRFLARYDAGTGTVRLAALSGEAVPGKDYELWFIQGEAAPVSLGLLPIEGRSDVTLTEEMQAQIGEGTVLAVTLEPEGGAPGGIASGPIVAAGAVTNV